MEVLREHGTAAAAAAAVSLGMGAWCLSRRKGDVVDRLDPDTVHLFGYGEWGYGSDPSPFVVKLEAFLKLSGVDYKKVTGLHMGPKHKMPWMAHKGKRIADSSICIDYLREHGLVTRDLDAGLSARQHAVGQAFQRLCEDHLYWVIVMHRWVESPGILMTTYPVLKDIPAPLRGVVGHFLRNDLKNTCYRVGVARFSPDELRHRVGRDLSALREQIGEGKYLLGTSGPTSYDCVVYAFIAALVTTPFKGWLEDLAKEYTALVAYMERMERLVNGGKV
eukprot:Sspe_Gene.119631::Locus_116091_Transcript_1_2_Confidence_0.400_Length_899::g.119631::m.119631